MAQEFILKKQEVLPFARDTIIPALLKNGKLAINGNLGVGKTFLSSQIIKLLTNNNKLNVTSPTFNIVNTYLINNEKSIYHFDLYRIKDENELENIGFFDCLQSGICIIEWPDVAKKYLQNSLFVNILNIQDLSKRKFVLYGFA